MLPHGEHRILEGLRTVEVDLVGVQGLPHASHRSERATRVGRMAQEPAVEEKVDGKHVDHQEDYKQVHGNDRPVHPGDTDLGHRSYMSVYETQSTYVTRRASG